MIMRYPRWKAGPEDPAGFYHCISRVVDRQFVFQERERERFRNFLTEYAAFCGVKVLTWCILSNHFHLLVEVPQKPQQPPPLEELIQRLEHLSGCAMDAASLRQFVERLGAPPDDPALEDIRNRLWAQMYDLSQFMKLLKQRFTQWFNRLHDRRGTLWEERFRSVWVEPNSPALTTIAAYIDLNPVRAGLVQDPKDYRWCGYGEAVAGNTLARQGLAAALGAQLSEVLSEYRKWIYQQGEQTEGTDEQGNPLRQGFQKQQVLKVLAEGGQLPPTTYLRLRIRYLTDGALLGSREWVDQVFQRHRDRFGPQRTTGARPLRGLAGLGLSCLRDLRLRVTG